MLYCGAKEEAPKGREKAKKPDQCIRQIRAFGRNVVEGGPHAVGLRRLLNNKGSTTKFGKDAAQNANCGKRTPGATQPDCTRQFRLFGLLPIVEKEEDIETKVFLITRKKTDTSGENAKSNHQKLLPKVKLDHAYTKGKYEGIIPRGTTTLFCSVISKMTKDKKTAFENPQKLPFGVGFAFGYFLNKLNKTTLTFNIVHVSLNAPYRKGKKDQPREPPKTTPTKPPPTTASTPTTTRAARTPKTPTTMSISPLIVRALVNAIKSKAKDVPTEKGKKATEVLIQVDPEAPCFQLGNPQYMNEKRSQTLQNMYTAANFKVVPLINGKTRRKVERTIQLN